MYRFAARSCAAGNDRPLGGLRTSCCQFLGTERQAFSSALHPCVRVVARRGGEKTRKHTARSSLSGGNCPLQNSCALSSMTPKTVVVRTGSIRCASRLCCPVIADVVACCAPGWSAVGGRDAGTSGTSSGCCPRSRVDGGDPALRNRGSHNPAQTPAIHRTHVYYQERKGPQLTSGSNSLDKHSPFRQAIPGSTRAHHSSEGHAVARWSPRHCCWPAAPLSELLQEPELGGVRPLFWPTSLKRRRVPSPGGPLQ